MTDGSQSSRRTKTAIAGRLRSVREEAYGDDGVPELAQRLGLSGQTWVNYENGVTIPGEILLRFIEATNAEPLWLLRGDGPKFKGMDRSRPQ